MIKIKISSLAFILTARTPEVRCCGKRGCKRQENTLKLAPRGSMFCLLLLAFLSSPCSRTLAQSPPLDLWSSNTLLRIRDTSTLNYSISARTGYFEVYFDSNNNATWADGAPPYAIHTGGNIRIRQSLSVTATMGMGAPKRRWPWRR
jgi:hypothetical protein